MNMEIDSYKVFEKENPAAQIAADYVKGSTLEIQGNFKLSKVEVTPKELFGMEAVCDERTGKRIQYDLFFHEWECESYDFLLKHAPEEMWCEKVSEVVDSLLAQHEFLHAYSALQQAKHVAVKFFSPWKENEPQGRWNEKMEAWMDEMGDGEYSNSSGVLIGRSSHTLAGESWYFIADENGDTKEIQINLAVYDMDPEIHWTACVFYTYFGDANAYLEDAGTVAGNLLSGRRTERMALGANVLLRIGEDLKSWCQAFIDEFLKDSRWEDPESDEAWQAAEDVSAHLEFIRNIFGAWKKKGLNSKETDDMYQWTREMERKLGMASTEEEDKEDEFEFDAYEYDEFEDEEDEN